MISSAAQVKKKWENLIKDTKAETATYNLSLKGTGSNTKIVVCCSLSGMGSIPATCQIFFRIKKKVEWELERRREVIREKKKEDGMLHELTFMFSFALET